jgi:hypothetical protein
MFFGFGARRLTEAEEVFYLGGTVRKLVVAGLLVVGVGCSTTSTIARISGPSVEGDIVGGSPDEIFVSNNAGGDFAIPRSDISEIDYPGNVHTLVGGITLGYGVLNIAAGLDDCQHENDQQAAVCTGVFLPAAIGAALMTWGIIVNQGQHSAAADTSRPSVGEAPPSGGAYPAWASGHRAPPPPQTPPEPAPHAEEPPPPAAPPAAGSASAAPGGAPAAAPPPAPPPPPAPQATPPAPKAVEPPAPPSKGFPVEK